MKRLITLIFSAALLSPMLAGAQSTPKLLEDLTWTGSLPLAGFSPIAVQGAGVFGKCNTITNFTLQLQLPSNHSPIIPVNGYYTCDPKDNNGRVFPTPFSGTMLSVVGYNEVSTPTKQGLIYIVQLRLAGPVTLECITTDTQFSMYCLANTLNMQTTLFPGTGNAPLWTLSWEGAIPGNFTLVTGQ